MAKTLLVDFTRNFLDGRPAITARTSKEAIAKLHSLEGTLDELWLDYNLGPADTIKPLLDYLILRAKIGSRYPVRMIHVHAPDEAGWQILSSKLGGFGYPVTRATIRQTLGQ